MEEKERLFDKHHSELINIAYGMLGNLSDARDLVQDAYLRWSKVDLDRVKVPERYLKKIVSRLCIDRFRSARHRREKYVGPWLPHPVVDSDTTEPDLEAELNDRLTMALLHVLEHLSPDQRAIFLLHDVFGYTFREIGDLLDKKPATCRKTAQRARKKVRGREPDPSGADSESSQIVDEFLEALQSRDMDRLQELLTDDAVLYSDGGGKVTAARKPIENMENVAKFLVGIAEKNGDRAEIERICVNRRPGFKAYLDGKMHSIWSFDIRDGKIEQVFAVLNPDKLPVHV